MKKDKKPQHNVLDDVQRKLKRLGNRDKAKILSRFFKTGPGEYGEGDIFLGVTMPELRTLLKTCRDLPLSDIKKLLASPIHEERMLAVLLLVDQFKRGSAKEQKAIFDLYISSAEHMNNWDLIDASAEHIVGGYLEDKPRQILTKLAKSKNIWERRMAIVGTFHFIKQGESTETFKIAELLLADDHDLLHKATGWMLREVGKRCAPGLLESFLDKHAKTMPRTMLRYAIERFPEEKRLRYLKGERK